MMLITVISPKGVRDDDDSVGSAELGTGGYKVGPVTTKIFIVTFKTEQRKNECYHKHGACTQRGE